MSKEVSTLIAEFNNSFPALVVQKVVKAKVDSKGKVKNQDRYSIQTLRGRFITQGMDYRGLVGKAGIIEAMLILLSSDWDALRETPYLVKNAVVQGFMVPEVLDVKSKAKEKDEEPDAKEKAEAVISKAEAEKEKAEAVKAIAEAEKAKAEAEKAKAEAKKAKGNK